MHPGRLSLPLLLLLASAAPSGLFGAAPAAPAETPSAAPLTIVGDSLDVEVVNVDVFVTDRSGKPVPGLKKGDFQLYEDGKKVDLTNFQELKSRRSDASMAAAAAPSAAEPEPASAQREQREQSGPGEPNYIAVYFDDGNIHPSHRVRAIQQLRAFLAKNVRPEDRVMLASYYLGLRIEAPFTGDLAALNRALDAIGARPGNGGEMERERALALRTMLDLQDVNKDPDKGGEPCSKEVKQPIESFAQTAREEALRSIHGLRILVDSLSGVPGRKTLLLISDGIPVTPGEELNEAFVQMCGGGAVNSGVKLGDGMQYDMRGSVEQVYRAPVTPLDMQKYSIASDVSALAARANANRVAFYSLQASGAESTLSVAADLDLDQALLRVPEIEHIRSDNYAGVLSSLASETGGRMIFNATQIGANLDDLWNDLSTHYSLGFAPIHKADGKQHRVEVKVKQDGLKVRHLQSYRDKPVLERAADRTLAALLYDIEDNALEVSLEVDPSKAAEANLFTVPIRLRIPLFKLGILNQNATFTGKLRLLLAMQTPDGKMTPLRQVEVPLEIPEREVLRAMGQYYVYNLTLQLKPGAQKLALAVRDEVTGTASFLVRQLNVGAVTAASASPSTQ